MNYGQNSVGEQRTLETTCLHYVQTFVFFVFPSASACSVLGVAQLDSVIIASPPIEDGVNLSLEHLQPYWEELQNLVQSKKIVAIGTSDLDKTQLEQLYQWAQVKDTCILSAPGAPCLSQSLLHPIKHHAQSRHHCGGPVPHMGILRQTLTKKTLENVC